MSIKKVLAAILIGLTLILIEAAYWLNYQTVLIAGFAGVIGLAEGAAFTFKAKLLSISDETLERVVTYCLKIAVLTLICMIVAGYTSPDDHVFQSICRTLAASLIGFSVGLSIFQSPKKRREWKSKLAGKVVFVRPRSEIN